MSRHAPSPGDRLRGLGTRIRALFRSRATEQAMSTELAFHVDMETEQNIRRGMTPADARRAAERAFGGVGRVAEQVRETRKIAWLDDLVQDLRHAARSYARTPGFTLAAVAALSLGIGANAAVFAVVHSVVFAPLPYAESDRLVRLWEVNPAQGVDRGSLSPGTLVDLRGRGRSLDRIELFTERDFLVTYGGRTWESRAASVTSNMFELLGVRPVLGNPFELPESDSTAGRAVISHEMWMERFGGDPGVIGRRVDLDYRFSYRITAVMPPGFSYPVGASLWLGLDYPRSASAAARQRRYFEAVARLRPGHTIEQAAGELAGISRQMAAEHPASHAGWTLHLERLDRSIVGDTRTTLLVLLGLAGCVLLVACGNVATLAVARATARRHETAVRIALGAARRRLVRQWTAEGLLLALLGGLGGSVVAYWSMRILLSLAPLGIPRLDEVRFSGAVVAFVLALTFIAALLVGLAPALRAGETRPLDAMRTRTASASAFGVGRRAWLVGAQVALTMVLTVAAALLLRSFERLQSTDLGYRRHDILSAEVSVPLGRFARGPQRWSSRVQFFERLMAELAAVPGVRAVAGTTNIPLTGQIGSRSVWLVGAPGAHGRTPPTSAADQWKAGMQVVTPGFFEVMEIPVVRGRRFAATDRFSEQQLADTSEGRYSGVAIINEAMARRFWPDGDPIGQRIVLFDEMRVGSFREIVGVVRDVRAESVASPAEPVVFVPFAQHPLGELSLVLHTGLPPAQLVKPVTDRLAAFDPALSISNVRPLDDVVGAVLTPPRFTLMLVGSFAGLALVIAGVGIFGIVGFLVTRRTHEIGIRMALGAQSRTVLWLVLREGLRPVVLGAVIGCVGAAAAAHAMRALLYGLAPLDVISFVASGAVLLGAAVFAALLPARRAAHLDPLQSLRVE